MKHEFRLFFEPDRKHPKRAIKALVGRFRGLELDASIGEIVVSEDGAAVRKLHAAAVRGGFQVSGVVTTHLTSEDALAGELGLLSGGGSNKFKAKLAPDAFDFSNACGRCGLGSVQTKPYVLGLAGIACKGAFYLPEDSCRVVMRADIGHEMAAAIGRPGCIRHRVTRDGATVKEWVEPMAQGEMPELSATSKGVTLSEPCAECGRRAWKDSELTPSRLVYSKAAIAKAQKLGVVEMREAFQDLPEFDARRRKLKWTGGRPRLLFSRSAVKVLAKYIEPTQRFPRNSSITPVFAA